MTPLMSPLKHHQKELIAIILTPRDEFRPPQRGNQMTCVLVEKDIIFTCIYREREREREYIIAVYSCI